MNVSIPADSKFKTKPFRHQLDCLTRYGRRKYYALLADMGTGKSWIIINDIADLWSSGDCDGALILAPNGVHENWTRIEIPAHMPDWVRYRMATWTAGANKAEREELDGVVLTDKAGTLRILAMNWDALHTERGFKFAKQFASSCKQLLIAADESDAAKNPSAAQTKALMKLKTMSVYRRIMSGTPIDGAPFSAYSQFGFLDYGILGTTSYFAFKAEYAKMVDKNAKFIQDIIKRTGKVPQIVERGSDGRPKYRNLEKLTRLIAPHTYRVMKKDCLDLPEKIYKTVIFRMTKQQIPIYMKAEDECRIAFRGMDTPFSKLVSVTKLAQITSGYYIHPDSDEPVRIEGENPKLNMLVERAKAYCEAGKKIIVWARFRIEIEDICKTLRDEGLNVVEYHGGTSKADRTAAIDGIEKGDAQVFVGNQQTGGTGITLVAASVVIYFSNDFSLRNRLQSEDRAHRIGQKSDVVYVNLAAKGTVDEAVVKALAFKKDVTDEILSFGAAMFGR